MLLPKICITVCVLNVLRIFHSFWYNSRDTVQMLERGFFYWKNKIIVLPSHRSQNLEVILKICFRWYNVKSWIKDKSSLDFEKRKQISYSFNIFRTQFDCQLYSWSAQMAIGKTNNRYKIIRFAIFYFFLLTFLEKSTEFYN